MNRNRLLYDHRNKCNKHQKSMMYRTTDISSKFIAIFSNPEECKEFVDNYNQLLDYIDLIEYENTLLAKKANEYREKHDS